MDFIIMLDSSVMMLQPLPGEQSVIIWEPGDSPDGQDVYTEDEMEECHFSQEEWARLATQAKER